MIYSEQIYNNNLGKSVAVNGNLLAIGNPAWTRYNIYSGYTKNGEVLVFQYNTATNNYDFIKTCDGAVSDFKTSSLSVVVENGLGSSVSISDDFIAMGGEYELNYITGSAGGSSSAENRPHTYTYYISKSISSIVDPNYTLLTSSMSTGSITGAQSVAISPKLESHFLNGSTTDEKYLLGGSPYYNNNQGAVYVYKVLTGSMTLYQTLTGPINSYFGASIKINPSASIRYETGSSGNIETYSRSFVIGTHRDSPSNKVYYYEFQSSSKMWINTYTFDNANYKRDISGLDFLHTSSVNIFSSSIDSFGQSVSIYGDVIAIGAPTALTYSEYSGSTIERRGAAYIYRRKDCHGDALTWELEAKVFGNSDTEKTNYFGYSVDVADNRVAIGSPNRDFPYSAYGAYMSVYDESPDMMSYVLGQVCVYDYISGSWILDSGKQITKRKDYGSSVLAYGYSVALNERTLVVGSPLILSNESFRLNKLLISEESDNTTNLLTCSCTHAISASVIETGSVALYYFSGSAVSGSEPIPEYLLCVDDGDPYEFMEGKAYIYNFNNYALNPHVGNVFYRNGKIIFTNSGSLFDSILTDRANPDRPYYDVTCDSTVTIFEKQVICRVEPGEFNVSTNPTAITKNSFEYDIDSDREFTFKDLDIISQCISSKLVGTPNWSSSIDEEDASIYVNYKALYPNTYNLNNFATTFNSASFDINGDNVTDTNDIQILWKWFIHKLDQKVLNEYVSPKSERKTYWEIDEYLTDKTGKNNTFTVKPEFLSYNQSSSTDLTGSFLAPYITTIGLYNNTDLVAVAKLGMPIKNSGEFPINLIVKWDN